MTLEGMGVEKAQKDKFQYNSQQFRWEESGLLAYKAAKFAILAPGLAFLMNATLHVAMKSPPMPILLISGLVATLLICVGFVCSIIALCNVGRLGREGLLRRGIIGLVCNGLLLTAVGINFAQGASRGWAHSVKAREARRNANASAEDMRQSLRQNFDPQRGVTNVDFTKTRAARASLDRAAAEAKGDEAKILKASAAYFDQMDTAARTLKGASTVLESAKVLQFTNMPTKEDFAKRRRIVQNCRAASEKVRAIITNSPTFYRAELQRLGMASNDVEKAVTDIQLRSAVQHELLCEVRDTDARVTDATLEIFDLLERHPDHWRIRLGYPSFTNSVTGSAYKQLLGQIERAGKDQVEAQRKLVNLR
jgi:hypothetical protein